MKRNPRKGLSALALLLASVGLIVVVYVSWRANLPTLVGDLFRTGPVAIAVLNPSFELQEPAEKTLPCPGSGCWYADDSVTYWDISGYDNEDHIPMTAGKTGVFHPDINTRFDKLPSGAQVAYSDGGTLFQKLPERFQNNREYTLSVAIGCRKDLGYTNFKGYRVALYAGGTLLASAASPTPGAGKFVTTTVTVPRQKNHPQAGKFLKIVLFSDGPRVNFDDVQLSRSSGGLLWKRGG